MRVEDTDKERSLPKWEKDILFNLRWLGLLWDEEVIRQSDRISLYKNQLQLLLEQGKAYHCFCTREELDAQHQSLVSNGEAPRYLGACRALSQGEQEEKIQRGEKSVIRFVVEEKRLHFHDLIRGKVEFNTALMGDIVIAKDLQTPLYNFVVVVDDHDMDITHVVRGEDHIPNTPKQILIQEALGCKPVSYAHLPLILAEDRTKLSKRHGDNSVTRFRKEGYLPEAILNFLALLGWNPGTDREIFSLEELVKEFSLERIQKGGAVFNIQRLNWVNSSYIRQMSTPNLAKACFPHLKEAGFVSDDLQNMEIVEKAVSLYKERLQKLSDISDLADFFFLKKLTYQKELLFWKEASQEETLHSLQKSFELLSSLPESSWNEEVLGDLMLKEAEKEKNRGHLLWPLRVALTGKKASAGPFEVASALGKKLTLQRIQEAVDMLQQGGEGE